MLWLLLLLHVLMLLLLLLLDHEMVHHGRWQKAIRGQVGKARVEVGRTAVTTTAAAAAACVTNT